MLVTASGRRNRAADRQGPTQSGHLITKLDSLEAVDRKPKPNRNASQTDRNRNSSVAPQL
jgi:hypothetical protein